MKKILLFAGMWLSLIFFAKAQSEKQSTAERIATVNKRYETDESRFRFRVQGNFYAMLHGGWGFNFGVASWAKYDHFQSSINMSANFFFDPDNLGNGPSYISKNSSKNPNKWMFNLVFSPVVTYTAFTDRWYYEEMNPFYFGGASGLLNNYKYSFSLGTSFVASPKGTYNNIMSPRNRSQQLIYFQLRLQDFQLNLYEDYFVITEHFPISSLCDNRDRYYTGGGNIQYRIGGYYKIKIYSEMYTGNSYVDKQEYPDIAYMNKSPHTMRKKKRKSIEKKLAFQDPGQSVFNKARNFVCLEWNPVNYLDHSSPTDPRIPSFNTHVGFIIGSQGGYQNMWQQNGIHNQSSVNTDRLDGKQKSKLHQFDNSNNFFPHSLIGITTTINY